MNWQVGPRNDAPQRLCAVVLCCSITIRYFERLWLTARLVLFLRADLEEAMLWTGYLKRQFLSKACIPIRQYITRDRVAYTPAQECVVND